MLMARLLWIEPGAERGIFRVLVGVAHLSPLVAGYRATLSPSRKGRRKPTMRRLGYRSTRLSRANAHTVELRLLLVAEGTIERVQRSLGHVQRLRHGAQAIFHRGEAAGRGQRWCRLAIGLHQIRSLCSGLVELLQRGILVRVQVPAAFDAFDRQSVGCGLAPLAQAIDLSGLGARRLLALIQCVEALALLVTQGRVE